MVNRRSSIARMSNVFNVVGVCICTINSSAKSCLSGVKVMTEAKAAGIFTLLLLASPQRALVTASSFLSSSNGDDDGDDFGGVLDWENEILGYALASAGLVLTSGALYIFCRRRQERLRVAANTNNVTNNNSYVGGVSETTTKTAIPDAFGMDKLQQGEGAPVTDVEMGAVPTASAGATASGLPPAVTYPSNNRSNNRLRTDQFGSSQSRSTFAESATGMAVAGTTTLAIGGTMAVGWNVVGVLVENLPWIGVAYHLLNDIIDIVDTKQGMQGNMAKIKGWAVSLQHVIVQMSELIKTRPAINAHALENMSKDVISELQELVNTVASYDKRGTLAQYAASRSCQKAVEAADTALRGALAKLAVGQGAEIMNMVGNLQDAGLVVDEKLDMIIEHLRKQEEHTARLELRLAEYSECMAEVLGNMAIRKGQQPPTPGKNLRELGKEALDKLQISKDDITYASKMPFATGTFSEVYQVIHEGAVKAAKKTNLARLGVGQDGVERVFKRFVKELYILSQMHSDRVVSVYGAIASKTELTLVMELLERGSLRSILDDEGQRAMMTGNVKYGILEDTAAGMTYLYNQGVEHRDLKCANCLVTHDWRVKITDFGLSRTADAISTGSSSTVSSVFRGGTMIYMAPELLPGGSGADGSIPAELSDIYSFGIIAWEVVCGNGMLPWAGVRLDLLPLTLKMGKKLEIPADCSQVYRKLMLNCWRREPNRRPRFERILSALKKNQDECDDLIPSFSTAHPRATNVPIRRTRAPIDLGAVATLEATSDGSPSEDTEGTGGSTYPPSSSHHNRNTSSSSLERSFYKSPARRRHRSKEQYPRSSIDGDGAKTFETPSGSSARRGKSRRGRATSSQSPYKGLWAGRRPNAATPQRSPARRRGVTPRDTPSRSPFRTTVRRNRSGSAPEIMEHPPPRQDVKTPSLETFPPGSSPSREHARHRSAPEWIVATAKLPIASGEMMVQGVSTSGEDRRSQKENGVDMKVNFDSRSRFTSASISRVPPASSVPGGAEGAGSSAWNSGSIDAKVNGERIGSPSKSSLPAQASSSLDQVKLVTSGPPFTNDEKEVASGTMLVSRFGPGSGSGSGSRRKLSRDSDGVSGTPGRRSRKTPGRERLKRPPGRSQEPSSGRPSPPRSSSLDGTAVPERPTTPPRTATPGRRRRTDGKGDLSAILPRVGVETLASEPEVPRYGLVTSQCPSVRLGMTPKEWEVSKPRSENQNPTASLPLVTPSSFAVGHSRAVHWRSQFVQLPPSVEIPEEEKDDENNNAKETQSRSKLASLEADVFQPHPDSDGSYPRCRAGYKSGDETARSQSVNIPDINDPKRESETLWLPSESNPVRRSASMDSCVMVKRWEESAVVGHRPTKSNDDVYRSESRLQYFPTAPYLISGQEKEKAKEGDDETKIETDRLHLHDSTTRGRKPRTSVGGVGMTGNSEEAASHVKKRYPSVQFVHGFRLSNSSDP